MPSTRSTSAMVNRNTHLSAWLKHICRFGPGRGAFAPPSEGRERQKGEPENWRSELDKRPRSVQAAEESIVF